MKLNHYETLGINQSATSDEIRRAYRILARRYHPDLNPGKASEERFKQISIAYQTLSDSDKRRQYDTELDSAKRIKAGFAAYEKAQKQKYARHKKPFEDYQSKRQTDSKSYSSNKYATGQKYSKNLSIPKLFTKGLNKLHSLLNTNKKSNNKYKDQTSTENSTYRDQIKVRNLSVVEVSISTKEAITGVRKSIEIQINEKTKKISIRIPSAVRTGSVLRIHSSDNEEFVIIIKVAPHPLMEITAKGLLVNLPVSIKEAMFGANIKVPGIDGEENIAIPAGSQSGDEIRLTSKGIKFESGQRGDLFYRLLIQIPSSYQAVGIEERVRNLSEYYESAVRNGLPDRLVG